MASTEKQGYREESTSPASSAVEPTSTGEVNKLRSRFPGFSLEVRREPSSFARTKGASNADFDPIPPSKRTWTWGAYVAYWMADAWAVSNWEVASSMIKVGLSYKMAIGACVLGNALMGLVITINGRIGATVSPGSCSFRSISTVLTLSSCTHLFRCLHGCRLGTTSATLSCSRDACSPSCGSGERL